MDPLRNWLRRARGATTPIATTATMGPAVRRTLLLRVALGVLLIGLVVAAVDTGRSKAAADRGLVPGGIGGVLALRGSRGLQPGAEQTITEAAPPPDAAPTRTPPLAVPPTPDGRAPPPAPPRPPRT